MLRPLWWDLAIFALPLLAAWAAVWAGRSAYRWNRGWRLVAAVLCVTVLLLPIVVRWAATPTWVGATIARAGGVTTIESLLALFLLGIVLAAPKRRMSAGFVMTLMAIVSLVLVVQQSGPLWWRWAAPRMWTNRPDGRGCLRQSTGVSCAAAAAAMLLHRVGIDASEGEMAYLAGTSRFGTDEHELARALDAKVTHTSLAAHAGRRSLQEWAAAALPFVAFIDSPFGTHAVLVEAILPDSVRCVDPLEGEARTLTRDEFERVWLGVGVGIAPRSGTGAASLKS